jgi:O-antigen ligase
MTSFTRKGANLLLPPLPGEPMPATEQPAAVARFINLWVVAWCIGLLGYAVMGRGFAYLGVPPLFVGEILMLGGCACLLVCGRWWLMLRMPQTIALLVLCGWCVLRTVPFLRTYGIDAARDSIIYLYSLFAFAVAGVMICRPQILATVVNNYRLFMKVFLLLVPFLWILFQFLGERLPTWPGTQVPIIYLKAGDLQVHLGAILAFMASEVAGITAIGWFVPMFITAALLGPVNRGGMVSFGMAIIATLIFKPFNRWAMGFIVTAAVGLSVLGITGISFQIPGSQRDISFEQLATNVISVFSKDAGNLDEIQGTKQWRLDFWNAIIDDASSGSNFWGKGFGINLVSDYGFQIDEEEAVRAPHNGHITMLARTGIPGFCLWVITHLLWAGGILDCYIRSRWNGQKRWAGLFMFLLIYWMLIMINASFDPYIEGPMGGVWLWSVWGVGLAAMYLRTKEPELFEDAPAEWEQWWTGGLLNERIGRP